MKAKGNRRMVVRSLLSKWTLVTLALTLAMVISSALVREPVLLVVSVPVSVALVSLSVLRERVKERAFVRTQEGRSLRTAVESFVQLTKGSNSNSAWAILRDLLGNSQFGAQMDQTGGRLAGQLLAERFTKLFDDARQLEYEVADVDREATFDTAVRRFGAVLTEYRHIVELLMEFLGSTRGQHETIQEKAPYSVRIHRHLADEYDRVMDDIRRFRQNVLLAQTINYFDDALLARFPRAQLYA